MFRETLRGRSVFRARDAKNVWFHYGNPPPLCSEAGWQNHQRRRPHRSSATGSANACRVLESRNGCKRPSDKLKRITPVSKIEPFLRTPFDTPPPCISSRQG